MNEDNTHPTQLLLIIYMLLIWQETKISIKIALTRIRAGLLPFEKMCNFTQAQSRTHILDGYNNAESVIHWEFDDIRKWDADKSKSTDDQGRFIYWDRRINCLQVLVYWITDMLMRGKTIVLDKFGHQERGLAIDMAHTHNDER